MSSFKTWLAAKLALIPLPILLFLSIFMLLAPIFPEPHLLQKFNWLVSGLPFKAMDVFDVFWHLLPTGLLVLKLAFGLKARRS